MSHKEIFFEENKKDRNLAIARLYKEGEWYRAYEWSAYLIHNYPNNLKEIERLTPNKRKENICEDGLVSVGLQIQHLPKFLPNIVPEINEKYMDIVIDLSEYGVSGAFSYKDILKKWKETLLFKPKKHNEQNIPTILTTPMRMTDIFKTILEYQLETHTCEESHIFIRHLKNMCLSMI